MWVTKIVTYAMTGSTITTIDGFDGPERSAT